MTRKWLSTGGLPQGERKKAAAKAPAISDPGAAGLGATGIPGLPAHTCEALKIGRARALGLPVMDRDGLLGLPDLARQFGKRLLHLASLFRDLANGETGGLIIPQSLAILSELGPMPRDVAVAVCSHVNPLSRERDHDSAARSAQGQDWSKAVNADSRVDSAGQVRMHAVVAVLRMGAML